jgi:uncharacterized membrane protein YeaQ/YmgE (transglycosylase-associated protein family)
LESKFAIHTREIQTWSLGTQGPASARLIGDIAIGIVGAFIGDWLLPQIGIHLGTGTVSAIVNATIGAVLLLLVVRLLQGGGRFGGWGRRRWW